MKTLRNWKTEKIIEIIHKTKCRLLTTKADHRSDKLLVHLIKRKRQKAQTWKIKRSTHFNLYEEKAI